MVKLKNTKAEKRSLKLIYYIKPVLGEDESKTNGNLEIIYNDKHCIEVKNLGESKFNKIMFIRSK